MGPSLYATTLRRAARILGIDALRIRLGVSPYALHAWLRGMQDPPVRVFLCAVDIVLENKVSKIRRRAAARAVIYDL